LSLDYNLDNKFSEEAKDLISKIFVLNPNERIGSGDIGT
jgi:hypothetical protein